MVPEGIKSEDLCKIRLGAGDKKTSGVAAVNKLNEVYGSKYRNRLDHEESCPTMAFSIPRSFTMTSFLN